MIEKNVCLGSLHLHWTTYSGKGLLQFTVCDVAITVHIHLFESSQQLSFLCFLLTLKDLAEIIKIQFRSLWGPVFIESGMGWISTSLLENWMG